MHSRSSVVHPANPNSNERTRSLFIVRTLQECPTYGHLARFALPNRDTVDGTVYRSSLKTTILYRADFRLFPLATRALTPATSYLLQHELNARLIFDKVRTPP
jgi:hypothetical protein